MVTAVLVGFALLSGAVFLFALLWVSGERGGLKEIRELEEVGVETRASLAHLAPIRNTGSVSVVYRFRGPNGEKGEHRTGMGVSPAHVVGNRYPLVHHPRNLSRVQMGTMRTVRRERRERENNLKSATRTAVVSAAACGLAIGGLFLGP